MTTALVIDDNRHMADSLCQMLQLLDVEATPAYGSRAALLALKTARPNIVFLDINMPGVSGHEVLGYLKREPELSEVPVVIVTSDDQPETAQRVKDEGAVTMIIKPASVETVEEALKKVQSI